MTVPPAVRVSVAAAALISLAACGAQAAGAGAAPARPTVTGLPPGHPLGQPPPTVWSPPPTPSCAGPGLLLYAGPPDAAMGLRVQTVTLTNCGDTVRQVKGYPRVRLLDEDGEPLKVEIDQGARRVTTAVEDPGPKAVTVRPGRSAAFTLAWRNTYGGTTRPPAVGATLVVTVGSGRQRVGGLFDLGSTDLLGVTAWKPVTAKR
ncbi:DUF4232 domain-containing protein [Nonomuraea jabiensis]|uniref:DUF4232 domain-containing protein n=1 Tax=Nonomuraea jabiensis TaxID=882448 RepID=A0A7W9GEY2_9ACTN|nr:DUF4232 domain-containing protein [Nonomuraea jabiensis]MBB5782553.1 hypothetical protein [Nonomuraea jabiensis]